MWCRFFLDLLDELVAVAGGILALALAARWALSGYFRQKEYELAKERYLNGAIDIVAAEIEQGLAVLRHNWFRCLNILKAVRDEGKLFSPKELALGFRDLHIDVHRVPNHRIGDLTGSDVIWKVYQLALAFVANNNTKITKEIPETIRLWLDGHIPNTEEKEFFDCFVKLLTQLDQDSHKFAHLTGALHRLSQIIEQEKLTFGALTKFRSKPEVQKIIADLQRNFESELVDNADTPTPGATSSSEKAEDRIPSRSGT